MRIEGTKFKKLQSSRLLFLERTFPARWPFDHFLYFRVEVMNHHVFSIFRQRISESTNQARKTNQARTLEKVSQGQTLSNVTLIILS